MKHNYHDTIELNGYSFGIRYEHDDSSSEPWKECDGHGIVSEWTRRDKAAGERILCSDRSSYRYYDVAAALKLARNDQWGCKHSTGEYIDGKYVFSSGHKTKGELAACAVDSDFEYLRAWCNNQWSYVVVLVEWLDDTDVSTALGGVETYKNYHVTVAKELAEELLSQIEIESPDTVLSNN